MRVPFAPSVWAAAAFCLAASVVSAQTNSVAGTVRDETGGVLPGVWVELRGIGGPPMMAVTTALGDYRFEPVASGKYQISFMLVNFAPAHREAMVGTSDTRVDVVLHLALSADVTVTGRRTFANLADVDDPAADLVGVAQSASQGAITARQLNVRPMMRVGEVLETVPRSTATPATASTATMRAARPSRAIRRPERLRIA